MDILNLLDRHVRSGMSVTILAVALLCLTAACGSGERAAPAPVTTASTTTSTTEAAPPATEVAPAPRPTAAVDEMVDVGHGRLHVRCAGAGDATVVLIAGFTGGVDDWAPVEPALAETGRVCAYDRFGTGTSDQPPGPQTFGSEARDLRTVLDAVGEPGPYVLVGHSFGGAEAVMFSSLFPGDVQGLLLLDASPPTWGQVICGVDDPSPAAAGWRQACEMQATPAGNPEQLDGPAAFAEVGEVRSLGDLPIVVATAPSRGATEDLRPEVARGIEDAWNDGQDHWAQLSGDGRVVVVPDTSHYVQFDQPEVVLGLVRDLLG